MMGVRLSLRLYAVNPTTHQKKKKKKKEEKKKWDGGRGELVFFRRMCNADETFQTLHVDSLQ